MAVVQKRRVARCVQSSSTDSDRKQTAREHGDNPILVRFGHLIPPNGQYPPERVWILWNCDESERVRDVTVLFYPWDLIPSVVTAPNYVRRETAYTAKWESDLGQGSPDDVLDFLLMKGFANREELRKAMEEFAKIQGFYRASRMLEIIKYA